MRFFPPVLFLGSLRIEKKLKSLKMKNVGFLHFHPINGLELVESKKGKISLAPW